MQMTRIQTMLHGDRSLCCFVRTSNLFEHSDEFAKCTSKEEPCRPSTMKKRYKSISFVFKVRYLYILEVWYNTIPEG
jgi:hypothetical protein